MAAFSSPHMQQVSPSLNTALTTAEMVDCCNAMSKEDLGQQNAQHNSSNPPYVAQETPLLWSKSDFEDLPTQKQLMVTDRSLTIMDRVDSGCQFHTSEPSEISPTVGAFTVQCAGCMKWRFIPTKEKYEVIRQSILEKPFFCSSAAAWRPNASCDDPLEISPELHELWAIDRPSIPLPPNGWERLIIIRPAGSVKFADIYYVTPSGKRLRSMPEIERFLVEHPEYAHEDVKASQFSFLIPRPLDKDYCRKKQESLASDDKGRVLQKKSGSKNISVVSDLNKIGIKQNSVKAISSKPKLEKLKCRKRSPGTAVISGGESQMFQAEEQSFHSLAFKEVLRESLSSEDLEGKTAWSFANATFGDNETVSGFATSKEQHAMPTTAELQGTSCHVN